MNAESLQRRDENIPSMSVSDLKDALSRILEPGQVTELRAIGVSSADNRWAHVVSGYFDDINKLAEAALSIQNYQGVYFVPNPVDAALLARSQNRIRSIGKQLVKATSDHEILRRYWLLIDIDPVRPSGISSSEMEHQLALCKAEEIRVALSAEGWPWPIVADSGNGAHLLYRIDLPVDDQDLIKQCLNAIAARFDTSEVRVDRKVFNPSRIWKLYGSWARKGDNTLDRPHRIAKLLQIPDDRQIVPSQFLERLVLDTLSKSEDQINLNKSSFDLTKWIADHDLELSGPQPWKDGRRWIFAVCPWNPAHVKSAYIVQLQNGAIAAGCHHDSCKEKRWSSLRGLYDPGNKSSKRPSPEDNHATEFANERWPQDDHRYKPEVLMPGEHGGLRVGHDVIAQVLCEKLPLGTSLFRHGPELIQLVGDSGHLQLRPLNANRLRVIIDEHVDLIEIRANKSGINTTHYRPCSQDLAATILATLSFDIRIPECKTLTSFPCWIRSPSRGWSLSAPGYDVECSYFYDAPRSLIDFSPLVLDPDNQQHRILVRSLLAKDKSGIFQNFPWANLGSAVNALAAVLTILMRPGIYGPTPLFLFTAPLPRSGKTLLALTICRITSGKEICVQALPENETEIRKGLLASLRSGATLILFDNVAQRKMVSSAALAGFITSTEFGDRLLGQSLIASYSNRATLFLTGNNVALSHELISRTIPIELLPQNAHPEARAGLPNLVDLVAKERLDVLSLLHGMILAWVKRGGSPGRGPGLAGFEDWERPVGGVLTLWGLGEGFGSNVFSWKSEADPEACDTERFLKIWHEVVADEKEYKSAKHLLEIAEKEGLFPEILDLSGHGRLVAFSKSILSPLVKVSRDLFYGDGIRRFRVILKEKPKSHKGQAYRLEVK